MNLLGPYPVKHAKTWIRSIHRRLPTMTGAMWCVGLWVDGEMRGLAVVGRPKARMLDVAAGDRIAVLEVLRVAVVEGTRNGCSMLYGACSGAAQRMGADGLLTYIHEDEAGVSLRAAGWVEDKTTEGGEWGREERPRQLALDNKPKRRWWAPWSAALKKPEKAA